MGTTNCSLSTFQEDTIGKIWKPIPCHSRIKRWRPGQLREMVMIEDTKDFVTSY